MRTRFVNVDYFTDAADLDEQFSVFRDLDLDSLSDGFNLEDYLLFDSDSSASASLDILPKPTEDSSLLHRREIQDSLSHGEEETLSLDVLEGFSHIYRQPEENVSFTEIEVPQASDCCIGPKIKYDSSMEKMDSFSSSIQVCDEELLPAIPPTPPVYAPSFFIWHGVMHCYQSFCIPSDGSYHVRSVPEMCGMRCIGSCYGWLILLDNYSYKCHLFNPSTLNKIQLPDMPHGIFEIGVLTASPTDQNCIVMLFSKDERRFIFSKLRDERWTNQDCRDQNSDIPSRYEFNLYCRSAVSMNRKTYLFLEEAVMVLDNHFDGVQIKMHEIKFPPLSIPTRTNTSSYFLESRGECFKVIMICFDCSTIVLKFVVFRLDLVTMVGEEIQNIGNRNFLLGEEHSTSVFPSDVGVKGNCIYYFSRERIELFIFDMDTGMITFSQLCPIDIKKWDGPIWLVPEYNGQLRKAMPEASEEIQETRSNLMPELLEMIFRNVSLDGIIRYRLASKAFLSIELPVQSFPPQVQFNSKHLPWLISLPYKTNNICHFHHPVYSDVYTMSLPQLSGAIVRHAKFGWLLMSRGNTCLFFFNPLTLETIDLPDQPDCRGYMNLAFSAPPTYSDYVVFVIEKSDSTTRIFSVYRKVQDRWSRSILEGQLYKFTASRCNPVFHEGVFYCLSREGKIGVFDPSEMNENYMWRVYTDLSVEVVDESNTRSYLVECDGDIFSIFVGYLGAPLAIYELYQYNQEMQWIKVENLGDRLMFLSQAMSLLMPAVLEGTKNRIYFPRFKGRSIVFYSLTTCSYHSFMEERPRPNWIDTFEQHWNCAWFQNIP